MNKFVNILTFLLLAPTFGVAIFAGFDLPVEFLKSSGNNLPFLSQIFLAFAVIFFMINGRRAMKRWTGLRMVNQQSKFQWNHEIDKKRKSQVNMYLIMEGIVYLLIAFAFHYLTDKAIYVSIVFVVIGLDHILFLLYGNIFHKWRLGITNKAIVIGEREFKAIYFSGLRRVSVHQQTLFFDYKDDLQLAISIDSVSPENRATFRTLLEEKVNRDRVYFSEEFKTF